MAAFQHHECEGGAFVQQLGQAPLVAMLHIRMNEHRLHKSDEDSRGGVATCFEERASEVCSLFVGHVLSILHTQDIVAETTLSGVMSRLSSVLVSGVRLSTSTCKLW